MKIGIEATALTRAERTGVDHYTSGLVSAMSDARPVYRFDLCYFWSFTKRRPSIGINAPNVRERSNRLIPSIAYRVLYKLGIAPPFDLFVGAKDQFFLFPNFVRWPLALCRHSAVVVHDLSYIRSRRSMTRRLRRFLKVKVPASMYRCDFVITPSYTIKNELVAEYAFDPARIIVATPAADRRVYRPLSERECRPILDEYGLEWRRFILFVGTIEPRKNILGLLDAYAALPADVRAEYPLVLAGGKGWLDSDIIGKYEAMRREGYDVRALGYVPRDRLPVLYGSSAVFVFPSFYEGFGMPVLEAMACGAPVVTSSRSSMPEVAGGAAALADPDSPAEIAAAIERVVLDRGFSERLRTLGLARAEVYSWEESARVVLEAIEAVVHGK
jgi:O-antigen biosynthesis alpha-1,3-mannosyltransferase